MTERTSTPIATPAPEAKSPAKVATLKKVAAPKAKISTAVKVKNHPSTASMVKAAVKALAEKNGSSLQAIKKYIVATYKLDAEKLSPFIRKSLKSAVIDGTLIQVKGKGANGSFKLPVVKATSVKPKSKPTGEKKAISVKKPAAAKKPVAKKINDGKKAAVKKAVKKIAGEKKGLKAATKAAKPKTSAPKAKKVAKAPTAKPKAPKPKKVTASKAAKPAVKKAVAKK